MKTQHRRIWQRLMQFKLRTLLFVTFAFCLVFGYIHLSRRQRAIVAAVRQMGGIVEYDFQTGGNFLPPSESNWFTKYLRERLGEDYVHRVVSVEFDRLPVIEQVKPITIETLSRDRTPPVSEIGGWRNFTFKWPTTKDSGSLPVVRL